MRAGVQHGSCNGPPKAREGGAGVEGYYISQVMRSAAAEGGAGPRAPSQRHHGVMR